MAEVHTIAAHHIAYALLPYKRNQDVIRVHELDEGHYVLAVADGWNRPDAFPGDEPGRDVAQIVAKEYPKTFLSLSIADPRKRAFTASKELDERIAKKYPRLATAVAVFVFHLNHNDIIVSIGDVETYLWDGSKWYKPKEISDHWLDYKIYESNVSRFFGASEHKRDPRFPGVFSAEPDVMTIPYNQQVLIATDGIKDVLSLSDINALAVNPKKASPKKIVEAILHEVSCRGTQRDDISLLVRS
ncbi:protein phosphatase 2C family protein [Candidatus Gottesmanbacteria bacterium]|nr:protein phosphatase 2C family protein [Candidatus Gottesmanbacteria bacterium]